MLFKAASKREALYLVHEDIKYLKELIVKVFFYFSLKKKKFFFSSKKCEAFRNFLVNLSFRRGEQLQVFETLGGEKSFNKLTIDFLGTLIDNKRLDSLPKIVDKYIEFYKILNREENIRIISASVPIFFLIFPCFFSNFEKLGIGTSRQRQGCWSFEEISPRSEFHREIWGLIWKIRVLKDLGKFFKVDPTILGGLQMYSGNNFMDCSLLSRVQRIKSELTKMSV